MRFDSMQGTPCNSSRRSEKKKIESMFSNYYGALMFCFFCLSELMNGLQKLDTQMEGVIN